MNWRKRYDVDGVTQLRLMTMPGYHTVKDYVQSWVSSIIHQQGSGFSPPQDLTRYHLWQHREKFPHESSFIAKSRFTTPPTAIANILLGDHTRDALRRIGLESWEPMDEGMGWLGFRIIRPGYGDGYPLSCKNWGASKDVVSFWLPMFGFGAEYSLKYVPGSHQKEYKSYLPSESKFTKDELRLAPDEHVVTTSEHVAPGNALMYGPQVLHTEDVQIGSKTRINIEFRALPL